MNQGIHFERIGKTRIKLKFKEAINKRGVIVNEIGYPEFQTSNRHRLTTDDKEVLIDGLNPESRYFFSVQTDNWGWTETGERCVPLEGAANFRDLGGYQNRKAEVIPWGKLYRADGLHHLSQNDLVQLASLKIKTVIDFRTEAEAGKSPDRLPQKRGVSYIHLPIKGGEFDFATAMKLLTEGDASWPTGDFMVKNYETYLRGFPKIWRQVFLLLADTGNFPVVFHCTAGKDRTGACSALIMSLLKIPEHEIIYDHQLSNQLIAPIVETIKSRLESEGYPYKKLEPFFSAPLNALERLLEILREEYGSVESYLTEQAGMSEDSLKRVCTNLLRPVTQERV